MSKQHLKEYFYRKMEQLTIAFRERKPIYNSALQFDYFINGFSYYTNKLLRDD